MRSFFLRQFSKDSDWNRNSRIFGYGGIGIGLGIWAFPRIITNQTNIFWDGMGNRIELNIFGLESKLNWNRILPESHIIERGW